jgi:hypothetical protein
MMISRRAFLRGTSSLIAAAAAPQVIAAAMPTPALPVRAMTFLEWIATQSDPLHKLADLGEAMGDMPGELTSMLRVLGGERRGAPLTGTISYSTRRRWTIAQAVANHADSYRGTESAIRAAVPDASDAEIMTAVGRQLMDHVAGGPPSDKPEDKETVDTLALLIGNSARSLEPVP